MFKSKLNKMVYGGDYYPEQWDKSIWEEDMRMFKKAGIDFLRINIFAWALNQRDEITYHFEWLDEVLDYVHGHGMKVCLGTSTGAHPAWMAKKYPDILRVEFDGSKRKFGGRHNSCPNSPTYRKYAAAIAGKLAARYKDHPALELWNISNEFGGACYCDLCEKQFRVWLKERYGTLENVNKAWNTTFWSHSFYDWDEIVAPNKLSEQWGERSTCFQGISLDYSRFNSDSILECYKLEYEAIKQEMPHAVITTNLMGAYKPLDYFKWGKYMDIISWDNYPSIDTPRSYTAMMHDLMRGLKDGKPWLLMEQTPSQQNWQAYNSLKRPGVMRLWSYQAVARGSDSVLFFQMRRSVGACEKFHGAVIEHVGHENTRVFREVSELGHELQKLGETTLDSLYKAKVGIVFDWENWWAVEYSSGPNFALKYVDEVHKYYKALYDQNIQADLIGIDTDLSKYDVVIAPVLYMVKEGYAQRIEEFVQKGGTFVTTFLSGIVNESDLVTLGGYPGELRKVLGIWAEEIDALAPEHTNQIVMKQRYGSLSGTYSCNLLYDLIHSEGADVIAEYGDDFYKGRPVVTVNSFGKGKAWYIASSPDDAFLNGFLKQVCAEKQIAPLLETAEGIEVTQREKDGKSFLFIMNHTKDEQSVELGGIQAIDLLSGEAVHQKMQLAPYGVAIIQKQ
ncbi:beta-galactosidase [Marinicrinis lubricantis]|uniref:Beta-galactosidase n=1 Tax=Marinicrinis lubricantis TaxID=2086470 RepID=A0ABW1IL19_9BACL